VERVGHPPYGAFGSVEQIQNGTNLVSTYLFNPRLQPCWMYATTGTALATSTLCTATDSTPGNILDLKYCFYTWSSGACSSSTTNNGNVIGITNNRDTTRTQNFTYDQVNRIVSAAGSTYAQSSAHCWGETYTYDQWANMSAIGSISSSYTGCVQDNLSVSATTNNQLSSTGFSYDAAGNMLTDNVNTYAWNAESEMKSAAGVTYTYDGDGNRLEKSSGKIYWYGAGTEILDESDLSGNFTNEYVFFGGKRIAIRNVSAGTIDYYEEDMLGSSRTLVQAGGTSPCFDADFLPFGYEKDVTTTCSQNYKFEGKERDTETGDDDFGARYYTFRLGRWLSADWSSVPAPVPYANLTNPQTLNLYAMVNDNPESFADLDGHCGVIDPGAPAATEPCSDPSSSTPDTQGEGQTDKPNTGTGADPSPTQKAQQPAPTNPDGSPKSPTDDVPKLPDGKPPGWKPGDPLVPNEWVPGKGTQDRPVRWDPKYPIPDQSQPNVSWDPKQGHWDHNDGKGKRTHWLPGGGGKADHFNYPIPSQAFNRAINFANRHPVIAGVMAAIVFMASQVLRPDDVP
jgi:RHS repeat-associated protein